MALGYTQATGGATFTAEQVHSGVIEPLNAKSVVLRAARDIGSPVYITNGVPLKLPRITSVPITDPWRSENTEIGLHDPTMDNVTLLPSSLKSLKSITKVADELVKHSIVRGGGLQTLGKALVNEIGLVLDEAFLVGTGASNTIKGLANATGVQTMPSVGAITIDDLHDAQGLALAQNAEPTCWFGTARDFTSLRKVRTVDGAYILQPDPQDATTYTLLGLPFYISNRIPIDGGSGDDESTLMLVDMNQVAIARDVDMEVRFLTERYSDFGQVGIRIVSRWDIAPQNAKGVVVMQGVKPAAAWTPPS